MRWHRCLPHAARCCVAGPAIALSEGTVAHDGLKQHQEAGSRPILAIVRPPSLPRCAARPNKTSLAGSLSALQLWRG